MSCWSSCQYTLQVRFPPLEKNLVEEVNRFRHDQSMEEERLKPVLDLTDCLEAFSTQEILDGPQAWFCPVCERNRRATKTLSVWRYPDFLIVHLKTIVSPDIRTRVQTAKVVNHQVRVP